MRRLPPALLGGALVTLLATASGEDIAMPEASVFWKQSYELAVDRPGLLAEVPFREGDSVKQGQMVIRLEDSVAQAQYDKAKKGAENTVDIEYAEKNQEVAIAELEKAIAANRGQLDIVPELEVKRLVLSAERARLQLKQAKFQQEVERLSEAEAKAVLEQHNVYAPADGLVVEAPKLPGEAVTQGEPVLKLVNTTTVQVHGNLPIAKLKDVRRGMQVRFTPKLVQSGPYTGKVVLVDLYQQPLLPVVRVIAELENTDGVLIEGLKGTLTVITDQTVSGPSPTLIGD